MIETKAGASASTADSAVDQMTPDGQMKQQVCTAVALGWQMAELFHEPRAQTTEGPVPAAGSPSPRAATPLAARSTTEKPDLPGVGKLRSKERRALRVAQLAHGLDLLSEATADEEVQAIRDLMREDAERERVPADLRTRHVALLSALTVADFRLGKAYGLGRALFEVCREGQDADALQKHLGDAHLRKMIAWCADLKSVLPDHAAQAVVGSLRRWQSWSREKPWTPLPNPDFERCLRRQGERWRAILTGEKDPRDALTIATYIQAGEELLSDAARVGAGFAKRFWLLLLLAAALLIGGIVAAIFSSSALGGLAAIAASLGITWKTATPTLSKLASDLSGPLWGAELDAAITVAVTDSMVPASETTPPSYDRPLPVRHATEERRAREAARQVWKRLDRGTRRRLLPGRRSPAKRLSYRFAGLWRGGSRAPFMPRDVYLSYVQSALETRLASKNLEANETSPDELFGQFQPDDVRWMETVVHAALTRLEGKHPFRAEPCEEPLGENARLVLFGDWGTGTPLAQALASRMRYAIGDDALREQGLDPTSVERHVIHLGDVYYCGEPDEYKRRFLPYWPASKTPNTRSWNLNGNHDMYSGGHGYFGLISGNDDSGDPAAAFAHQNGTSFFRIFNDHWQIIGLDSAYEDNDLYDRQLQKLNEWLGLVPGDRHAVPAGSAPRKTILLTHHQLGSARAQGDVSEGIRQKTAAAREAGLVHAWFWGHEHRAFVYEPYLGVKCPVCIGNGGVPELLSHVFTFAGAFQAILDIFKRLTAFLRPRRWHARAPRVAIAPKAVRIDRQGLRWEELGFVMIDLKGENGRAAYWGEETQWREIKSFTV